MARFNARIKRAKVKWIPTIAAANNSDGSPGNPTRVEITAGVDLTPQLAAATGFEIANSPIDTPDLIDSFTPSIPGEDKPGTPSLTFYEQFGATDAIRTSQAKDTAGFLYVAPHGDVATYPTEIWRVNIASNNRTLTVVENEAAKYVVQYSPTSRPNQAGVAP